MISLILTIMLSALAFVSMGANDCGTSYQADINDNATGLSMPLATQSQEVGFTYDALGRRLSKTFGTTVTRWVWNGNVPLHQWRQRREYSGMEGGWKTAPERRDMTLWLFDEESFVPAAMLRDGRSYSILTDQLGTPTEAYDNEGNEVWSRVLDMDGNVLEETGNVGMVPFLLQGQYYDRETGLAYNRFRYYDPKTGAYISQDPIRLAGRNLTIYGYVKDPNYMVDIWGLDTVYSRKKRGVDGKEKPYVGSAKHGIKKRYTVKDLEGAEGKDVFTGLDHDTSRGLEQIIFERGKTLKGNDYWANKYNPVSPAHAKGNKVYKDNMDKYTYRTEKAKEAMQQQYGDDWLAKIDEAFGF